MSELQQRCVGLQSQQLPQPGSPLVSIILVAYNQQQFIRECLASVLAQRYVPLDIIVLDDASADLTAAVIADELAEHPDRGDVRFIRNERNLGMFGNPEKGLSLARGEFVIICDGDDVMLPNMVEKMVAVWRRENVSLVTGNVMFIDEHSNELNRFWRDPTQPYDATPETLARTGNNALCFGVAIGFERALYQQFGYPPEYLTAEDIMLPFYACLAKGARFIPEPVMKYRVHPGNGGLGRAVERQTTAVGECLVQAEIYYAELAHSVLMAAELDRVGAADPARAELAERLKPLVAAAILDKSKLLVDKRIELSQLGVAQLLASHPLVGSKIPQPPAQSSGGAATPVAHPPAPQTSAASRSDYLRLAAAIPGWREGEEAAALFDASFSLPADSIIVEVGAFFGRSAVLLAGARRLLGSGKVHCVDPFDCSGDDFSAPIYQRILAENGGGRLREHFDAALLQSGLTDWVEVHQGTAVEVAATWNRPIDLLLLDGDHSPAGAMATYAAWAPYLREGGLLVLDNSIPRQYAADHDGNYRVAVEKVGAPDYADVRRVGFATFARRAVSATVIQPGESPIAGASTDRRCLKLFTAIYDDARLLPHFLRHYRRAGIGRFHIAVAPGFAQVVQEFSDQYPLTICEGLDVTDSWLGGASAVSAMRRRFQQADEWAVIVDLDEFIEFTQPPERLAMLADAAGDNVIRGIMYDRFARDGGLPDFAPDSDLARVYPVRARFTRNVMHGTDFKGVMVKGLLMPLPDSGHHAFAGEQVHSRILDISHYKWNSKAIDRVKSAYQLLSQHGKHWAEEYKRVLDHYEQHGRFAWEEFDGELVSDSEHASERGNRDPLEGTLDRRQGRIRIIEASYGLNVFGTPLPHPAVVPLCRGNATNQLAALLNGRAEARLMIDVRVLGDPAPGFGKDLTILYYYADAPVETIHRAYLPAEAHGRLLVIPPYSADAPVETVQSAEHDRLPSPPAGAPVEFNESEWTPLRPAGHLQQMVNQNQLLSRKYALEAEMQMLPADARLRRLYFDVLNEISFSSFGSFFAVLPDIATPMLFRGGTSDVWSMEQIFLNRDYELPVPTPRRILDLGAYAGYTAVFFANRYPAAEIISVEPGGSNFDTLATNAKPYANIRCLSAAVSAKRGELVLSDVVYGDWGTCYEDGVKTPPLAPATGPVEPIAGYTISDILEMNGWDGVDLIKCSSHSGRVDVLLRPRPYWLETMVTLITRPGAAGWRDEDAEKLQAVLPDVEFERTDHGAVTVFSRRSASSPGLDESSRAVRVIPEPPHRRAFALSNVNVADRINFFKFGHSSIQLMPSPPGSPARGFSTQIPLDGHCCFSARLATGDGSLGRGGIREALPGDQGLIRFRVRLLEDESGRCVLDAERVLPLNAVFDWDAPFIPSRGLFTVVLSTEHVSSDVAGNPSRTAYFIEPHFHCQRHGLSAGQKFGGELKPDPSEDATEEKIPAADGVTVVLTSCGRQDLLEQTLDSFLAHNTFPIQQFIVIEDGDGSGNERLVEKYREYPFTWLATGHRVGQVAAIDIAYSHVNTEWIFHCEDDWEFTASGFIEKSLIILKNVPHVLQVYLRALNDTNRHPVLDEVYIVEDVPYRLMCHNFNTEWGFWHGFAWNPGLRRRRDYQAMGSFGSLDPSGSKLPWEVEWAASEFYRERGFFAAILIDNGGLGYVRHLGDGRHVPDRRPVDLPFLAEVAGGEAIPIDHDVPILEPVALNGSDAIPSEPAGEAPGAERSPGADKDGRARLLADHLATLPHFCAVPRLCTRDVPGIDDVPEWQIWSDRETTPGQLDIEEALETLVNASSSILHVGAGNSGLAKRFASRVRSIVGITKREEEVILAQQINIKNYTAAMMNKYDRGLGEIGERFDFIVDNNPASFACCLFHVSRMMVTYLDLLKDQGRILIARRGLGWVVPGNDKNWSLRWEDWVELGRALAMSTAQVTEHVYAMERDSHGGVPVGNAVSDRDRAIAPVPADAGGSADGGAFADAPATSAMGAVTMPILAYHSIAEDGPPELRPWRITPAAFDAQLRLLRQHGYRSISLEEWAGCIAAKSPLAGRAVVITFDDGYADFLAQAAPRLEAAGFRATVFVVTGRVGRFADWDTTSGPPLQLMGWDDLRALQARGFSIGSHMSAHRDLTALSDEEIERDTREARAALRRELGHEVTSVAFPGGTSDARVHAALARSGYRIGVEIADRSSTLSDNIACLPRIEILADDDIAAFAQKLGLPAAPARACPREQQHKRAVEIADRQRIINHTEVRFIGLQRSGNHAVINWIARQSKGSFFFLSDIKLFDNPYDSMEEFEHYVDGRQIARLTLYNTEDLVAAKSSEYYQDVIGNFTEKEYLLYNYEDKPLSRMFTSAFEENHDRWLGVSARRFDVLIMRDPYNMFASRLKARNELTGISDLQAAAALWKEYAKEYLGMTGFLRHNKLVVNFNNWFMSQEYREKMAATLGLDFTDAGLQEISAGFGGSSFDKFDFDSRAQHMQITDRWRQYQDDAGYQEIFQDQELVQLAQRIYGNIPGTDVLLRSRGRG